MRGGYCRHWHLAPAVNSKQQAPAWSGAQTCMCVKRKGLLSCCCLLSAFTQGTSAAFCWHLHKVPLHAMCSHYVCIPAACEAAGEPALLSWLLSNVLAQPSLAWCLLRVHALHADCTDLIGCHRKPAGCQLERPFLSGPMWHHKQLHLHVHVSCLAKLPDRYAFCLPSPWHGLQCFAACLPCF